MTPITTRNDAFNTVKQVVALLDAAREQIAASYAGAQSHSDEENALGECLTFVRKAIEKAVKAGNDLGQLELSFGEPQREE